MNNNNDSIFFVADLTLPLRMYHIRTLTDDRFAVMHSVDEQCHIVDIYAASQRKRTFAFRMSEEKMLVTVGLSPDGKLLVITQEGYDRFAVEKVMGGITETLYQIVGCVTNAVFRKDGSVVVGSQSEKQRFPAIRVFDKDGNITYEYDDPNAIECGALSLDVRENVWFRLTPFEKLYCVENGKTRVFDCELPEITDFAISADGKRLLAGVVSSESDIRLYQLERRGQAFVCPVWQPIENKFVIQHISLLQDNLSALAWIPKEYAEHSLIGSLNRQLC